MISSKVYIESSKNSFSRQISHCSCGTINISANIPLSFSGLSMPQCICSVRTDAVYLERPLLTLGLYTSSKREPQIHSRRLVMSNTSITVSFNQVSLSVEKDKNHSYLMATAEVAKGYGITESAVRYQMTRHKDEINEGEHFVS